MELYRPLRDGDGTEEGKDAAGRRPAGESMPREEWLDYGMRRREWLIQELRYWDDVLVPAGRLRARTLPKRVR